MSHLVGRIVAEALENDLTAVFISLCYVLAEQLSSPLLCAAQQLQRQFKACYDLGSFA